MAVLLWEPDQPVEQGCPILNKTRTIAGPAGVCGAWLRWDIRNITGNPVDLDELAGSESGDSVSSSALEAAVRFADPCGEQISGEAEARIVDGGDGLVEFQLPEAVCQNPGLYQMSVAAFEAGDMVAVDEGLLSLEPNLWVTAEGAPTTPKPGIPTFNEIRIMLRDFPQSNSLIRQHEFGTQEILSAVRWAVMDWNEQPPSIRRYSCRSFPWKRAWLDGIAYQLLEISAHAYARNDAKGPAEMLVNDQAKMQEYLGMANMHFQRWREFCKRKKIEIQSGVWSVG